MRLSLMIFINFIVSEQLWLGEEEGGTRGRVMWSYTARTEPRGGKSLIFQLNS